MARASRCADASDAEPHAVLVLHNACGHIKLLYWDGDGFVMYYKRLEKGRFDMPSGTGTSRELRRDEMLMLIEGLRLAGTRRKERYRLPQKC